MNMDGSNGMESDGVGILEAQEALESCAKAVQSGRQQGPLIAAFRLVSVVWDGAPLAKRYTKKRPESADSLRECFSHPCGEWLPFAEELGAGRFELVRGGEPTQFCKLMSMPRRR